MSQKDSIDQAIASIKNGGIAIFPTDTAFGIGCRIDRPDAIDRLFNIKKRSAKQATPVLTDSLLMIEPFLQPVPKAVKSLMDKYWPGALTIVLHCKTANIPAAVRGEGETLGVRMPDHAISRAIIRGVGVPIIGTSANFHGKPTPFRFEELDTELLKLVDVVVPGICIQQEASTIIDCTTTPWTILRQGAVKISASLVNK